MRWIGEIRTPDPTLGLSSVLFSPPFALNLLKTMVEVSAQIEGML